MTAEGYRLAHPELMSRPGVSVLDVGPLAPEARRRIEQEFPRLIYSAPRQPLAGRTLLHRLSTGDINLWWLTEIAEKSPFRGQLVSSCYQLALLWLAWQRGHYQEMWLAIADRPLAAAAASCSQAGVPVRNVGSRVSGGRGWFTPNLLLRRAYLVVRLAVQRALLCKLAPRRNVNAGIAFYSSYPLNWSDAYSGDPKDRMYGALNRVLAPWKPTSYLLWIETPLRKLWRDRRAIAAGFLARDAHPLLLSVTNSELLARLAPSRLVRLAAAMRAAERHLSLRFEPFQIAPVFLADLRRSLASGELAINELHVRAVSRYTSSNPLEYIVHWGEFQPVEKAIWYGLRERRALAVALQHTTATAMFLNYSFIAGELEADARAPRASEAMPLPDLFVSTGEYAAAAVARAGFPVGRTRVCGGIRFRGLLELATSRRDRPADRAAVGLPPGAHVLLVTTTSKQADNENMVTALMGYLRQRQAPCEVIVKCHPMRDDAGIIARRLQTAGPHVRATPFGNDTPLHLLIAAADVMVGNSSASGLESIALGIPVVFFHNPNLYDVNALYSMDDAVMLAADTPELIAALNMLERDEAAVERLRAAWPGCLGRLLYRLDTAAEDRCLAFLREHASASTPASA